MSLTTCEVVEIPSKKINTKGHDLGLARNSTTKIMVQTFKNIVVSGVLDCFSSCTQCGKNVFTSVLDFPESDGNYDYEVSAAPCKYPDGVGTVVTHLEVPSGRLIISDALHLPEFKEVEVPDDYNSAVGKVKLTKAYEEIGIGFGYVGNTCPSVYVDRQLGGLCIANFEDESEFVQSQCVGTIVTDVWAYAMMDLEDYYSRGGEPADKFDIVVDIDPGRYRISYFAAKKDFNEIMMAFMSLEGS